MASATKVWALAACGLALLPLAARAEGSVSFGIGAAPDYLGSDDIKAVPMPGFAFDLGDVAVKSSGVGVEANVAAALGAPRGIGFGPILRYDLGRNDGSKVRDDVVALTAPIQAAPEIGGFAELGMPLSDSGLIATARLSVVQGMGNGPQGTQGQASLGLLRRAGDWTLGGRLTLTAGSGDYNAAQFGVSAADAAASGLAAYQASGGIYEMGLGGFVAYAVNDRLSVNAVVGLSRLTDRAAASPLVAERGAREQSFVGLGVTYSFR